MARKSAIPNFLYGTLGLAVLGTATYYAVRSLRRRAEHAPDGSLMQLRRSTRNAGRAVKDSAQQIGKETVRGFEDTGEALTDVGKSGLEYAKTTTDYNRI